MCSALCSTRRKNWNEWELRTPCVSRNLVSALDKSDIQSKSVNNLLHTMCKVWMAFWQILAQTALHFTMILHLWNQERWNHKFSGNKIEVLFLSIHSSRKCSPFPFIYYFAIALVPFNATCLTTPVHCHGHNIVDSKHPNVNSAIFLHAVCSGAGHAQPWQCLIRGLIMISLSWFELSSFPTYNVI